MLFNTSRDVEYPLLSRLGAITRRDTKETYQ